MLLREELRSLRNDLLTGKPADVWLPRLDRIEEMQRWSDNGCAALMRDARFGVEDEEMYERQLRREAALLRRRRRGELLSVRV